LETLTAPGDIGPGTSESPIEHTAPMFTLRFTAPPTAPELQVTVKPATTVALVHPSPDVDHPDAIVEVRGQRAPAVPEVLWVWV
jgi:hypothetical protein